MFEKETTATPLIPERIVDLLRAPNQLESSDLVLESNALVCSENNRRFEHVSGVPSLLQFDDIADPRVTQKVKDFYEEYPFPNYEGIEEFGDLVSKGTIRFGEKPDEESEPYFPPEESRPPHY